MGTGASNEKVIEEQECLRIDLDNKQKSYYPGQMITGNVVIVTHDSQRLRAVRLRICGETKVHISESHDNCEEYGHPAAYKASEIYVKEEKIFWGDYAEGTDESELDVFPAGSYHYPFQFQLPRNCVASLEKDIGYVRYYLKLIVDKGPWKFDENVLVPLTVLPVFDLKLMPQTAKPIQQYCSKEFLFSEGNIEVTAELPKLGYVANEVIPMSAHILNTTDNHIVGIDVRLVQMATFTGYSGQTVTVRSETLTVAETERDFCADIHKHTDWVVTETLAVPQVPPSLFYSPYIHITYKLRVKVIPSGITNPVELELPIVIGTLPVLPFFHAVMPTAPLDWVTDELLEQQFQEQMGLLHSENLSPHIPHIPITASHCEAPPPYE